MRYIETSADEVVDANWTVEEDAWKEGGGSLADAVTGLTNGTEYDVQVRAVDVGDVDGAWSATTGATPADHGGNLAMATSVTAVARVWGTIDPADDEDYFSFSVSGTADYWMYTLGDLDTVGELLDSNDMPIESDDYGAVLPNPDNFFLWYRLQSGTYFIKVTGFGPADEPYILRVREFTDTTSRSNAATLNLNVFAGGTIDPEDDDDYFRLELSAATEVAIRASGFPDTVGELQRSNGTVIAANDDGYLPGNRRNFLIRENLAARRATQPIGTPDEIIERIQKLQQTISLEKVVLHVFYGGMPRDKAEKSLRLFAKEVLPEVQAMATPINPRSLE